MSSRILLYLRLIRIDKPIGYMLLMWPTLWGLWVAAGGWPGWPLFLIFTAGSVLMHSAGCAINDFADRDFDRFVKRTKDRPLTAGEIAPWEAVMVAVVLSLLSFLLILRLNALVLQLAVVALVLAGTYPWFKRFFVVPQAWLGIAFGFGIPMAFAAVRGEIPMTAWYLMLGNLFWTLAYDTEYAMVDRDDDLKVGIRTSAITFGQYDVFAVMLCYALMLLVLFVAGLDAGLGGWFVAGLVAAAICVVFQYRLIRTRERMKCFLAFRGNNLIGLSLFAGILLDYTLH
ncbi:4-hydroxybenzoate octaprenyltransferase [Oxalobacter sp. OttesenSCG-928-P03]|nr:4-hydroxybenzoate octaprenyltransferase [Oxalobacter sp. OttesenSCG-928-P03]